MKAFVGEESVWNMHRSRIGTPGTSTLRHVVRQAAPKIAQGAPSTYVPNLAQLARTQVSLGHRHLSS